MLAGPWDYHFITLLFLSFKLSSLLQAAGPVVLWTSLKVQKCKGASMCSQNGRIVLLGWIREEAGLVCMRASQGMFRCWTAHKDNSCSLHAPKPSICH